MSANHWDPLRHSDRRGPVRLSKSNMENRESVTLVYKKLDSDENRKSYAQSKGQSGASVSERSTKR